VAEEVITGDDWDQLNLVVALFYKVRAFVCTKFQKMKRVALNPLCREILKFRQDYYGELKGRRAMMHVAHHPYIVCSWAPAARKLSVNHLIGLYLHEFGHLGSRGDDKQADRWVDKHFGIAIYYTGELELEWVTCEAGERVLAAASTRPRRSRPSRR